MKKLKVINVRLDVEAADAVAAKAQATGLRPSQAVRLMIIESVERDRLEQKMSESFSKMYKALQRHIYLAAGKQPPADQEKSK